MRSIDISSWHGVLSTLLSLVLVSLVGVGIRLVMMQTIQQRRERMNRQINERLKTLIAAYKTLGGSFTGQLTVDPTHLREVRLRAEALPGEPAESASTASTAAPATGSERARRTRDAVEAALADILLLGTADHCRLAGQAASDLAAGRPIHTAELVISLRNFIRTALDLEPMPDDVAVPLQGPARAQAGAGRGKGGEGQGRQGGGGGGGGGGMEGGGGMGLGLGTPHADGEHEA